ncbi:MAG: thermonuclease family protein [Caulobacter sp.]|nr:thermonuclease family protein [Caulobacter sp.]
MPIVWALILAVLAAAYFIKGGFSTPADAAPRLQGALVPAAAIRITDGDTFRIADERIRIANIDTPEMPGRARCDAEAQLALVAKARLGQLLSGGEIRVARDGVDRYGRTLATVSVDGADVGEQLVREGAARRWEGHRARWC